MPMLRVRSSVYSRLGELGDFVLSVAVSILSFENKNTPAFHLRGVLK
jgi:hypothetical protein